MRSFALALAVLITFAGVVRADDLTLILKDHKFTPTEIKVPAAKSA